MSITPRHSSGTSTNLFCVNKNINCTFQDTLNICFVLCHLIHNFTFIGSNDIRVFSTAKTKSQIPIPVKTMYHRPNYFNLKSII